MTMFSKVTVLAAALVAGIAVANTAQASLSTELSAAPVRAVKSDLNVIAMRRIPGVPRVPVIVRRPLPTCVGDKVGKVCW